MIYPVKVRFDGSVDFCVENTRLSPVTIPLYHHMPSFNNWNQGESLLHRVNVTRDVLETTVLAQRVRIKLLPCHGFLKIIAVALCTKLFAAGIIVIEVKILAFNIKILPAEFP